jgi:hypothetical protein
VGIGSFHGSDLMHIFGPNPGPPATELLARWIMFAYYLDPNPPEPIVGSWVYWPTYHGRHRDPLSCPRRARVSRTEGHRDSDKGKRQEVTEDQEGREEEKEEETEEEYPCGEARDTDESDHGRVLIFNDWGLSHVEPDSFRRQQTDYLTSIVDSIAV